MAIGNGSRVQRKWPHHLKYFCRAKGITSAEGCVAIRTPLSTPSGHLARSLSLSSEWAELGLSSLRDGSKRPSLEDTGVNQECFHFTTVFPMLPVCACLHEFTCMERSKVNLMSSSEVVCLVYSVKASEPGDQQEGQAGWSLSPTDHPVSPSQG